MNLPMILLQATALMLTLILLRPILKRFLSARARCALWLLPALRMLFPFQFRSALSLMAKAGPVAESFEAAARQPVAVPQWLGSGIGMEAAAATQTVTGAAERTGMSVGSILLILWLIGAAALGTLMLCRNLGFRRELRRCSVALPAETPIPVYLMAGLPSPCLVGIFRPAIYVTEYALASEEILELTVRHETAHLERRDHLWHLVRGLLLVLYWFHPLVWICGELFRRDCEAACDETVTRGMDASGKEAYGMALIALAYRGKPAKTERLLCLSTMGGSKKALKERIVLLTRKPVLRRAAVAGVALAAALCFTMCTLPSESGAEKNEISKPEISNRPENTQSVEQTPAPGNAAPAPTMGEENSYTDLAWFLEYSAAEKTFLDMNSSDVDVICAEYGELLQDFRLMGRVSADADCAYIIAEYCGATEENPFHSLNCIEFNGAQVFYTDEVREQVKCAVSFQEIPETVHLIFNSRVRWQNDGNLLLIQSVENRVWLDDCFYWYTKPQNGRAYIMDAVARGVAVNPPTGDYLEVYLISAQYGEITERIPLREEQRMAILSEDPEPLPAGFGFGAGLAQADGERLFYNEHRGVPPTVLRLAVDVCGYKFFTPDAIAGPISEAKLECSWLQEACYADAADLERLGELLRNAEFGYVGGCGYGAKLTVTLASGETLTIFKGSDGCDSIVFGSFGGYFLGDKENLEFWRMFGLDPDTKNPVQ